MGCRLWGRTESDMTGDLAAAAATSLDHLGSSAADDYSHSLNFTVLAF